MSSYYIQPEKQEQREKRTGDDSRDTLEVEPTDFDIWFYTGTEAVAQNRP